MATLTAEEQLKKLKQKERQLRAKIKAEKEKEELKKLKELQKDMKYLEYVDLEDIKLFVNKYFNQILEEKNYKEKVVRTKLTKDKIKYLLSKRIKSKVSSFEIESINVKFN